jgi:hypothetical protein
MSIFLWREGTPVPIKDFAHIIGINTVATCAQVLNILSFLKNSKESQSRNKLQHCISLIESVLEEEEESESAHDVKLQFVAEQLQLLQSRTYQRRYSLKFLATCVLWENTSPNLYRQLVEDGLMTLPNAK